jgi:hypothetical protein
MFAAIIAIGAVACVVIVALSLSIAFVVYRKNRNKNARDDRDVESVTLRAPSYISHICSHRITGAIYPPNQ